MILAMCSLPQSSSPSSPPSIVHCAVKDTSTHVQCQVVIPSMMVKVDGLAADTAILADGSGVDGLALANVGVADPLVVVDEFLDGLDGEVGKVLASLEGLVGEGHVIVVSVGEHLEEGVESLKKGLNRSCASYGLESCMWAEGLVRRAFSKSLVVCD